MLCLICQAEFDQQKEMNDPLHFVHYGVCPKCIKELNLSHPELKDHPNH